MNSANLNQSNETSNKKREKFDIEKLRGKRFGRLNIIGESKPRIYLNGIRKTMVLCECECGSVNSYMLNSLKRSNTKSCGCLNKEQTSIRFKTHGQTIGKKFTSEYRTWAGIKTRTTNPKRDFFKDYGGRGILVCAEWLNSFEQFFADMGKRPSSKHSIERRKVNEGYNKDNCYWATPHEQAANKRNNSKTVGVRFNKKCEKWVARLEINKVLVLHKEFKTELEAIAARNQAEKEYNIYQ